jgi:hypothetical protein
VDKSLRADRQYTKKQKKEKHTDISDETHKVCTGMYYQQSSRMTNSHSCDRMWRGTSQGFQNWDQCLRLLQSLFRSSSGVIRQGSVWYTDFKTVTDDVQKRIPSCRLVRTHLLLGDTHEALHASMGKTSWHQRK